MKWRQLENSSQRSRATTALLKLVAVASFSLGCSSPDRRVATVPSELLDQGGSSSAGSGSGESALPASGEQDPTQPAANDPNLPKLEDLQPPSDRRFGKAETIPLFVPKVGDRFDAQASTDGSANAARDSYSFSGEVTKVDSDVVREVEINISSASMSAFAGRSSLNGNYKLTLITNGNEKKISLSKGGGKEVEQLEREELSTLPIFLGPPSDLAKFLSRTQLQQGQVRALTADERKEFGSGDANISIVRQPDKDGLRIIVIYSSIGDDLDRVTFGFDPSSGQVRSSESISYSKLSKTEPPRYFVSRYSITPRKLK